MKLRNLILGAIMSFAFVGAVVTPTWATDASDADNASIPVTTSEVLPAPTFVSEEIAKDAGAFWFGKNLLFAANNATADQDVQGLMFAAGNNLQVNTKSEYAFVAGNNVAFSATTAKDLFLAGNVVSVKKDAKVGRDVFAAAYEFTLEANISGDVSAAASRVILRDVTISGNANFDADNIIFEGEVEIDGTLTYNEDASVSGLSNVKYGKLETYVPETRTVTAAEIWLSKIMSVVGLFVTIAIIFIVFPRTKAHIARETTAQRFGVDLAIGLGFAIIVPLLSLLFLLSFFAASTAIFLIAIYLIFFYLAKAFTGAWLGYIIVEKLCRCKLPMIIEALIGILIITCLTIIPGLGLIISTLTLVFGSGLIIACLRSDHPKTPSENRVYYTEETVAATANTDKPAKTPRTTKSTKVTKTKSDATTTKRSTVSKSATKSAAKKTSTRSKKS